MSNPHRGEIAADLGGHTHRLRLTLGALAELEAVLGEDDLASLVARFEAGRFSARELTAIIGAGLRGAGVTVSDDEVAAMGSPDGLAGYISIVSRLLTATFPPAPPRANGSSGESKKKA